jgi:Ca2+-binding RTX toxin-like protein
MGAAKSAAEALQNLTWYKSALTYTVKTYYDLYNSGGNLSYLDSDLAMYTYGYSGSLASYFKSLPNQSTTVYNALLSLLNDSSGTSSSSGQTITGTDAADTLEGGTGKDTITGGAGNDSIAAGAGNDKAYGGSGDDTIDGGDGADYMEGQSGADTYYVDNAKDTVKETDNLPEDSSGLILESDIGSTIDAVISSVKHTLTNYVENLTLTGASKIDGTGNGENNTLIGNAESNKLSGKVGNDSLDGGAGNDTLKGDAGADTLIGGAGADKLTGGTEADIFVFASLNTTDADADAISDFAEADALKFDTTVFTSLAGVTSDNLAIDKQTTDLDANDYLIYDSKKGILYYDADGTAAVAAIKIAGIKGTDAKTTFAFDDLNFA